MIPLRAEPANRPHSAMLYHSNIVEQVLYDPVRVKGVHQALRGQPVSHLQEYYIHGRDHAATSGLVARSLPSDLWTLAKHTRSAVATEREG